MRACACVQVQVQVLFVTYKVHPTISEMLTLPAPSTVLLRQYDKIHNHYVCVCVRAWVRIVHYDLALNGGSVQSGGGDS